MTARRRFTMPTVFETIRQAWQSGNRDATLPTAVEQLAADGVSRATLDEALGVLLDEVRAVGGDEAAEEIIAGVGDRLHGWCLPTNAILTADTRRPVPAAR